MNWCRENYWEWLRLSSHWCVSLAFFSFCLLLYQSVLCPHWNPSLFFVREVALRNSPSKLVSQLQLSSSTCHIVVALAQNDSPEFRKQSEEYYKVSSLTQKLLCKDAHSLVFLSVCALKSNIDTIPFQSVLMTIMLYLWFSRHSRTQDSMWAWRMCQIQTTST